MDFMALAPLMAPAGLVIAAAVVITLRERRPGDTVLDLTDVPRVRLEPHASGRANSAVGPLTGDLVPARSDSLGARMQSAASSEQPVTDEAARPAIRIRRRGTPLVAGRR